MAILVTFVIAAVGLTGEGLNFIAQILTMFSLTTYGLLNFAAGSGRIDLWWKREGENTGLMLTLAYLLKTSPEWKGSLMTLKTSVATVEEKLIAEDHLFEFIKKENVDAKLEVKVSSGSDPFEAMRESSSDAEKIDFDRIFELRD
ncbi:MAG: hypothetical protein HQL11_02835 [Candidatus Omnitrophica bacterium]|nr:hypothetical protein [Candidatus Omnitrophota bacterium]